MLHSAIQFFLERKLVTLLLLASLVIAGLVVSPFESIPGLPRSSLAVDAIPDIGENQQIISVSWPGRSPQDVENQITYPLSAALTGISGVKAIRSSSLYGLASIAVVFDESVEFYWSRSRILEKLNALPKDLLPQDVQPTLGPDATAIGQVFWYTLEPKSDTLDPQELRVIQDFQVSRALSAVEGVSEVASIGGFVQEYQVDLDPAALQARKVSAEMVMNAVRSATQESGAGTIEMNRVEYFVRGLGFVRSVQDLEDAVVTTRDGTPVRIKDVARVRLGPTMQRGALDRSGGEAVGGVVVARHGANPMEVIQRVKKRIAEIEPSLPVHIEPFYDRSGLIEETLLTLREAIVLQVLITVLVVILLMGNPAPAALVSLLMPVAVLMSFLSMKLLGIEANIVSLSGIAIAIGALVDLGIILTDNILLHKEKADPDTPITRVISDATREVALPIVTALSTTVVGFLPVFALQDAEGKLFKPLAFTKSFAMIAALLLTLFVLPTLAALLFRRSSGMQFNRFGTAGAAVVVLGLLIWLWKPLGMAAGFFPNLLAVLACSLGPLVLMKWLLRSYPTLLTWLLAHRLLFWMLPLSAIVMGFWIWKNTGREFMPALNEGAFLLMPIAMPHAGVSESRELMRQLDLAVEKIPEVKNVVGKMGRVESALDPAPVNMFENLITYHPEYGEDSSGKRVRLWRDHIRSPEDIWSEIAQAAQIPGVTGAPKLQPIETRLVMLQTGMRSPFGIKVQGNDLVTLEAFGIELERILRTVPAVRSGSVYAERATGKPYLELHPDREAMARYGISMTSLHMALEAYVGGMPVATTIAGRERYDIRVRWPRELRDSPAELERVWLDGANGEPVPLGLVARVEYSNGPESIRSENGFLTTYVTFDGAPGLDMGLVAQAVQDSLSAARNSGRLEQPHGVQYHLSGTYENQLRAEKRLAIVVPIVLVVIFLILYLQFRTVPLTLMVFSGIACSFAGGFIMLWLWPGNMNMSVAVWVGFIALFGLATDDGVVMLTYLEERFNTNQPSTVAEIRQTVLEAGLRRIRPCLVTTTTTLIALLPVLTSTGRGSDLMKPMAIPIFGGMVMELLTLFIVPLLYSTWRERHLSPASPSPVLPSVARTSVLLLTVVITFSMVGRASASDTLTLNRAAFLDSLHQVHPELLSRRQMEEAAYAESRSQGIILDPELRASHTSSLGSMGIEPDTRVGITQQLPWPGSRDAQASLQKEKARQIEAERTVMQWELENQALEAMSALQYAERSLALLDSQEQKLRSQLKLVEGRLQYGTGSYASVLRLQSRISAFPSRRAALQAEQDLAVVRLNQLLDRKATAPIVIHDTEFSMEEPDWEQALRKLEQGHPTLASLQARTQAVAWQKKVLTSQRRPMLMAGVDLALEKRMVMPMISVSLPLFGRSNKGSEQALRHEEAALASEKRSAGNALVQQLEALRLQWYSLSQQTVALKEQSHNLDALAALLQERLPSGEAGLTEWLDNEEERLSVQQEQLRLVLDAQMLIISLHSLTGVLP